MLFRVNISILLAMAAASGSALAADVYGFVEGGRVSVIYSDTPPADSRYMLFKKGPVEIPEPPAVLALPATKYSATVLAAAKESQVDPALIHAIIVVESANNPSARSSAGAVGLMQLMPETARRYGVKDRLDPVQNVHGGARYLRDLKAMFDDNLQLVLAAYNAGEEAVMKYGGRIPPYRETKAYVPKVLDYYRRFRPLPAATFD